MHEVLYSVDAKLATPNSAYW